MEGARLNPVHNPFLQVTPETRRVRFRQTDILVEVEEVDLTPIDVRFKNQSIEKLKLRGASSCNQISFTACRDRLPNRSAASAAAAWANRGLESKILTSIEFCSNQLSATRSVGVTLAGVLMLVSKRY